MSQYEEESSQQTLNSSVDYSSLTQEFRKNLFITDKAQNSPQTKGNCFGVYNAAQKQALLNSNKQVKQPSHLTNKLQILSINKKTKLVQKPINIIQVLSDVEEQQIFQQKIAQQRIKSLIDEAVLSGSKFNILKRLYKQYVIKDKSQLQKQTKFNNLIISFFLEKANIHIKNGHFKSRIQVSKDQQFLQNQYILYGVDMIQTISLSKMFFNQHPTVKWIDSSHCKLIFDSKMLGWQAVVENRKMPKEGKDDFGGNINLKTQGKFIYEEDQMDYQEQSNSQIAPEVRQRQRIRNHYVLLKSIF